MSKNGDHDGDLHGMKVLLADQIATSSQE